MTTTANPTTKYNAIDPRTGCVLRTATPAEVVAYHAQPVRPRTAGTPAATWTDAAWFACWARPVLVGAVLVDVDHGQGSPAWAQGWCD